jgi:hypothetical protein
VNGARGGAPPDGVMTVSESLLKPIQFLRIMLYVLVAGVMWGT